MQEPIKAHWEKVYETKQPHEVSWTQKVPQTSLQFILAAGLNKDAAIIDVGGGDSNLVDFLLQEGYSNITVLDISAKALERAQARLGEKASLVQWIEADIRSFVPTQPYDFWHDRAAFHFLTAPEDVNTYVNTVQAYVKGYLAVGTFSENGPLKCSGLEIKQYSQASLTTLFEKDFEPLKCLNETHITPFGTSQHFTFCCFSKK